MVVVGGGWCTYDYKISLSPNLWIMTFDLDLDLDLGLTILSDNYTELPHIQNDNILTLVTTLTHSWSGPGSDFA